MFVHIVFWRLRDDAPNGTSKEENAAQMKRQFEAMRGKIPGLLRCDVGIDIGRNAESADIALYSEFTDRAAFDGYYAHPLHLDIVGFIRGIRTERRVVDYET